METLSKAKTGYPSDVEDLEWKFVETYLTLMTVEAPQRIYELRDVFNALRYLIRSGCSWRLLPHDFPPWATVYQQAQRWIQAGSFEMIVDDLRELIRIASGKEEQPTAVIYDGQTLQGTIESGARAGFDGHKKQKGSKIHIAVDTLGDLLALLVTPANEQERDQRHGAPRTCAKWANYPIRFKKSRVIMLNLPGQTKVIRVKRRLQRQKQKELTWL
jgi:transposase